MTDFKHPPRSSATQGPSRRRFLKAAAQTGALLLAPAFIPAPVLGRNGAVPPSDKIIMGGIGIGGRGRHDLKQFLDNKDVQFVAICDAKRANRDDVKKFTDNYYDNEDCKQYMDIREFLAERTDIDAVVIATGDRWHALAATMAMRAGKDVYSEKPSSMTIQEGQFVVNTARQFGRIYQTGTQRLSEPHFVFANELLRLGKLGEVKTVWAHIAPWDQALMRHDWLPAEPEPPKEEVDWDAWLGPCPWRPFNKSYIQGGWRNHYDFHTSCIGEWGAHTFAQCQVAIDQADTSAIEYNYVDNLYGEGMECKFANGVKMILTRDMEAKHLKGSCAVRYIGDEGEVVIGDNNDKGVYDKPYVSNPKLLDEYDKIVGDYKARTGRSLDHWRDLLDCIKSRRQTIANPVVMHRSMSTVHAANICMWLKRDMKFDPETEMFVNDDDANRFRSRAQREPWIF